MRYLFDHYAVPLGTECYLFNWSFILDIVFAVMLNQQDFRLQFSIGAAMKPFNNALLTIIISFLMVHIAFAQNYEARITELLSEIDASNIEYYMVKLANATASTLANFQITNTAVIPFRDENNRRTGLTEFLGAEFSKKLKLIQTAEVMAADQVAASLKNQVNLAKIRWTQDCPDLAIRLEVPSLIRGRIISGANEISLAIDIYSDKRNSVIGTHRTNFPRTTGLARLNDLIVDETPKVKKEIPPPQPQLPPTIPDKPKYEPVPTSTVTTTTVATALEIAVRNLTDKLATGLADAKQAKIGVLEFLDLQGRISQLGKFMAEDLTTALFEKRKFSMVERGLLQQVMREHALGQTGVLDLTQAQEIGKMVGADAIITGSLSDIGDEIKANARLIDVREGTVLAVAGESIAKTENVGKMYNTILWSPEAKIQPSPQPMPTSTRSAPAGYVYFEDFKNVPDGMLPDGWLGGEKLMVKSDGRQKFVTDFEQQSNHKVLIDNITFPENFEFTIVFQFSHQAYSTHVFAYLGSLKLTIDVYGWYRINNTVIDKKVDWRNKLVKAVLTKEGPIFRLYINGEEVLLMRDTDYKLPQAISLEFQNMSGFRLMQVGLREI